MDKGILIIGGLTLAVIAGVVIFDQQSKTASELTGDDATVVSQQGMHVHPQLAITIKGERQALPENVGLGGVTGMAETHTHDASGELHWEINRGPVRKGQLRLARFFETWGEPFNREQILDAKTSDGGTLTMLVNDQPNEEFEQYVVKDGDQIEIRFE